MTRGLVAIPQKDIGRRVGLLLGPVLFAGILLFVNLDPTNHTTTSMAAIAALMAVWWITDAIPLSATALLPLVLFPLFGVMSAAKTAPLYVNSTIFLFVGGFLIALAMETWNLHRRIAIVIIHAVGTSPSRIVLGFMLAGAFLSMWISNTATAVMILPIGLAIIVQMESRFGTDKTSTFSKGLLLGIAYSASVGGMATLVGTPPNLSLARIYQITFPSAPPIEFGSWLMMGVPLAGGMLMIIWLLITHVFFRTPNSLKIDQAMIDDEYARLGRTTFEEKTVAILFALTALLWVFRVPLNLGFATIPGWSSLLPNPDMIDDGTVAMTMALVLFLIPSKSAGASSRTLLSADVIMRLPWNIVLLFGGGFALARGFQDTGLSNVMGNNLGGLAGISPIIVILVVTLAITFLTELTSNTATTEMILPVLASVAVAMRIHPLLLMIPATLAASQAFMMPIATPPNAIVFGSQRLLVGDMAKIGLVINLAGIAITTIVFYLLGTAVFGIDTGTFPDWAIGP